MSNIDLDEIKRIIDIFEKGKAKQILDDDHGLPTKEMMLLYDTAKEYVEIIQNSKTTKNIEDIVDNIREELKQLEIETKFIRNPLFCEKCDSCGYSECCQPRCMYGDEHQKDYKELSEENDKMYKALSDISKCDDNAHVQAIVSNVMSSLYNN